MEEEHVMAMPEGEVEDEDVRQTQDEAAEDEATEGDSSATPTIYERGPVSLPQPPLPRNRALIHPMAKR